MLAGLIVAPCSLLVLWVYATVDAGDQVQIKAHEVLINDHSLNVAETLWVQAQRITQGDNLRHWDVLWSGKQMRWERLGKVVE
jgi:predicted SnoaL-like aldol condensation-catalyzing enzyme